VYHDNSTLFHRDKLGCTWLRLQGFASFGLVNLNYYNVGNKGRYTALISIEGTLAEIVLPMLENKRFKYTKNSCEGFQSMESLRIPHQGL
jgi:hypothetical protein